MNRITKAERAIKRHPAFKSLNFKFLNFLSRGDLGSVENSNTHKPACRRYAAFKSLNFKSLNLKHLPYSLFPVPCSLLIFAISILLLSGCKTSKLSVESRQTIDLRQIDSVSVLTVIETKSVTVPQATAVFGISLAHLDSLPVGASYSEKSGNATVAVTKKENNNLIFTANCDSLTLLIETLTKEAYHFHRENQTFKSELNERKTEVIKEPSGWQWFQIYGFWILLTITVLTILIKKICRKKTIM
jgi:hypothetical protein